VVVTLDQLWERLGRVRTLSFSARSGRPGGWNGAGRGTVEVQRASEGTMTFTEAGVWRPEGGHDLRFSNVFRWSIVGNAIRLEHLRFGADRPVYLFDLAPAGQGEWRSASPHLCREDCYAAVLVVRDDGIVLRWSIDGPRKQETIEYTYFLKDDASS
jgi:hypothetical protein